MDLEPLGIRNKVPSRQWHLCNVGPTSKTLGLHVLYRCCTGFLCLLSRDFGPGSFLMSDQRLLVYLTSSLKHAKMVHYY